MQRLVDVVGELRRLAIVQRDRRALVLEQQAFLRAGELGEQLAQPFQRLGRWRVKVQRSERLAPLAGRETGSRRR
jgi:hypothetical protein